MTLACKLSEEIQWGLVLNRIISPLLQRNSPQLPDSQVDDRERRGTIGSEGFLCAMGKRYHTKGDFQWRLYAP